MPDRKTKVRGDDPKLLEKYGANRGMRGFRAIHVNGAIWRWKTNGEILWMFNPARVKHVIPKYDLYGMTQDEYYDRECDQGELPITPGLIIDYITEQKLS